MLIVPQDPKGSDFKSTNLCKVRLSGPGINDDVMFISVTFVILNFFSCVYLFLCEKLL